jgi:hypothetical protein
VIQLDEERKAAMVSNLLVVLCGETNASCNQCGNALSLMAKAWIGLLWLAKPF